MRRSGLLLSAAAPALIWGLSGWAPAAPETPPARPAAPVGSADLASQLREADDLYSQGAYSEALRRYEDLLARGQESAPTLYKAAVCYEQALNNKPKALELKRRALPLLEKEIASGGAGMDAHYYLAAIYINDLNDPVKGTDVARKGAALLERPKSPQPDTQEGLFRAGRLYSFLGKDKEAAAYYDRSVQAAAGAVRVDRGALKHALESLAPFRMKEKKHAAAAEAYAALLKLDPLRDRDRHQWGLALVLAGRHEEAAKVWKGAVTDELRTELNYLAGVVARYAECGAPAASKLAPNVASLDDEALRRKILDAAGPLRAVREKEAKERQEREDREREERAAKDREPKPPMDLEAIRAKFKAKMKNAPPPPDPNTYDADASDAMKALHQMGLSPAPLPPPPPPSPEKQAAERDFFFLLNEYVKRGHLIRNFCFENGLVEMIFR